MLLLEIDQEIFNIMLPKSMHQIVRIEFRNAKFTSRNVGQRVTMLDFQPPDHVSFVN